jgi:hypothetical protein
MLNILSESGATWNDPDQFNSPYYSGIFVGKGVEWLHSKRRISYANAVKRRLL